jgi:hypothetical protein
MRGHGPSASMEATFEEGSAMTRNAHIRTPKAGDRLVVRAHHQGQPTRDAKILGVLGGARPRYRVRWQDDGHESIVYPSEDVFIERPAAAR